MVMPWMIFKGPKIFHGHGSWSLVVSYEQIMIWMNTSNHEVPLFTYLHRVPYGCIMGNRPFPFVSFRVLYFQESVWPQSSARLIQISNFELTLSYFLCFNFWPGLNIKFNRNIFIYLFSPLNVLIKYMPGSF